MKEIELKTPLLTMDLTAIVLGLIVGSATAIASGPVRSLLLGVGTIVAFAAFRFAQLQLAIRRSKNKKGRLSAYVSDTENPNMEDDLYLSMYGAPTSAVIVRCDEKNRLVRRFLYLTILVQTDSGPKEYSRRISYDPVAWAIIKPSIPVATHVTALLGSWGSPENRPFTIPECSFYAHRA
jgi:hypothetical protein